jgi:hypothetical protein
MKPRIRESDVMESPPTPLRHPRLSDRERPDRTADLLPPESSGEYHTPTDFSSPVVPAQGTAPAIEGREMPGRSAEDIREETRQDGVRHLLTGRTTGSPAEYSFSGNGFVRSLIVGATSIRTTDDL